MTAPENPLTTATGWRPTHTDPLFILAMDQRDSFAALFGADYEHETDDQQQHIEAAKLLIYRGLTQAEPGLAVGRPGVLVDEQYGLGVIEAAEQDPVVLAVPIEASGQDWFGLQWGDQWLAHVRSAAPGYVKVLVRDNPDPDATRRRQQLDDLARVSRALQDEGYRFLYELLVPATPAQLAGVNGDKDAYDRDVRPELTVRVLADNQNAGVEPTIWKIEGLDTLDAARAVAEQARAGGRDTDLIVLGRDAPADRLNHWLSVASQVEAFVGFAIGRSNWKNTISDWRAGKLSDDDAAAQIAGNYSGFAQHWTP